MASELTKCWRSSCFRAAALGGALVAACLAPKPSNAAVAVLANRMPQPVTLNVLVEGESPRQMTIDPDDCRPLFANAPVRIQFAANAATPTALEPDCAYVIPGKDDKPKRLVKIPLGETPGRPWPTTQAPLSTIAGRTIDLKILVDEDERRRQSVWEPSLRARIAEASDVLVAHGGVPLRVVAVGQWTSDNQEKDFHRSLGDFERQVPPRPAQIAIGFTSQYEVLQGRVHMGGTRGVLYSHVLLRERAGRMLEMERLELLVHELGHLMGATHSDDAGSVMRPVVGQGQLRKVGTKIRFDPANTLLVALVGQEIRERGIRSLTDASPAVLRRMREIYAQLGAALPGDTAAGNYVARVDAAGADSLIKDTRLILDRIVRTAKTEHDRRVAEGAEAAPESGSTARDDLIQLYVRQAALAAKQVPEENGPRALMLALGIAVDDQGQLRELPLVKTAEVALESDREQSERLKVIGQPTMQGRADLPKHFFVSAHIVALAGPEVARNAGVAKEMLDANGGSGFSFRDMAADYAGIIFAQAVMSGAISLDAVAERFTVESYMPAVDDLREEMQATEFTKDFGGAGDPRFASELLRIESRILQLPAYSGAAAPAAAPAK